MILNSKVNYFERLFQNCIFERRYIDRATDEMMGATWNGADIHLEAVTGQKFNSAVVLNGVDTHISYGNLQAANIGTSDFSVEVVFKSTDTAGILVGKRSGGGNGWNIRTDTGPKIQLSIDDGTAVLGQNTTIYNGAIYNHALVTFDRSGNAIFYMNGSADGTLDISSASGDVNVSTAFIVGINGDLINNPFEGKVALARLWNRVLAPEEVSQLAATEGFGSGNSLMGYRNQGLVGYWPLGNIQATAVNDISGQGNHGTATSMSEANLVDGYNQYRGGLVFDGTTDTISGTITLASSPYSITGWVKVNDTSQTTFRPLLWLGEPRFSAHYYTSDKPLLRLGSSCYRYGTTNLNDNQWHHIAFIVNGVPTPVITTCKIYVDSIEENYPITNGAGPAGSPDGTFIIARAEYQGSLEDIMVFNRVLTQLDIELLRKNQLRDLKI